LSVGGTGQAVLALALFALVALVVANALGRARAAQLAAEAAETDLRLLVEGAGDTALLKLDAGGRVASWNAGCERLFGYSEREIIGQPLTVFFPTETAEQVEEMLARAAREGVDLRLDWRVRKDGSRFFAHCTLTAVHEREGALSWRRLPSTIT
jgi:PAS domain S-box-containing protein